MTPELALLVRAVLLGLLVLTCERVSTRLQLKRREARRTAVRLPATLNPVVTTLPGRPVQVSAAQVAPKPAAPATGHLKVIRLELQPDYATEKQAA